MLQTVEHTLPPAARRLLDYWKAAAHGDRAPDRKAIDPVKLREWIGDISLIELHDGEKRLYMKLHGMNVARYIGGNYSRGYLEDRVPVAAQPVALEPYFKAHRTHRPVYSVLKPGILEGSFEKFERLILPFANPDTGEVDRFLTWVGPTGRDTVACDTIYDQPDALTPPCRCDEGKAQLVVIE